MNNEIKEILYELNDIFQLSELDQQVKDIEKVLDYITNLQEENEMYAQLKDEYEDIIDKAKEYIEKSMNNPQPFYEYLFGDENGKVENLDKLLNILNGGDNND